MPLCNNCPESEKVYYTGEENTPLGRGISARFEKIGQKRKGKDGKMYIVVKVVNGKRWKLVKSEITSPGKNGKKRKTSPRLDLDPTTFRNELANNEEYRLRKDEIIYNLIWLNNLCKSINPKKCPDQSNYTHILMKIADIMTGRYKYKYSREDVARVISTYGWERAYTILTGMFNLDESIEKGNQRYNEGLIDQARYYDEGKDPDFDQNFPF